MSKYENFEKEVQEVEYFITNQWELFKDQAEQVLRNFSKNQKELDELRDFLSNMKLLPWMNNAMSSIQSSEITNDNKVKQINIKINKD